MVDLDLDRKGSYEIILPRLSEKMGKKINITSFIMALTGFREGPAYREILTALHELLENWPQQAA